MPKTTTQPRPGPGAPAGNQNAAKPPALRRVPVYVYLDPDTVRILAEITETSDKSRGKAIDDAVRATYGKARHE